RSTVREQTGRGSRALSRGFVSSIDEAAMLDRPAGEESSTVSVERPAARAAGDALWLLGRCLIGGLFLQRGFGKLLALDPVAASPARNGVPAPEAMAVIGAVTEFCGGLAIVVGFMTRPAALVMVAFTIVATLISHRFWELQGLARRQQSVQFAKNLAIIGGFLLLLVQGGGRLSYDGWRRRGRG